MKTIKTLLLSVVLVASAAALADDSYILYWYASVSDPYNVISSQATSGSSSYYAAIGVNGTDTYLTGINGEKQYLEVALSGTTFSTTSSSEYGKFTLANNEKLSDYNFYLTLYDGAFKEIYTSSAFSYDEKMAASIFKSGSTSGNTTTTGYGFTATAVPEPTSGLLMLLGLAGLALRRPSSRKRYAVTGKRA